jgi:hypothetical protein
MQRMLIHPFTQRCYHKIEHLAGKPQGPSLSFASGSPLVPFVFVFGFCWVFCSFFATAAVSDFVPLAEEPSSQNETFRMCLPKVSPWIVASSSSRAEGERDPSAPWEEVSWFVQRFLRITYSEGSGAPWRTTTDFRNIGELGEGLGISKGNVDDWNGC